MNTKLLKALPLLLGFAAGLSGCIDRTQSADPTSAATQEGGKVSFRLSSADLLKIGVGVDSVRIEAVREGFPLQVAMGSLTQDVVLANLASGTWTLRVALFDASQAIHYYGEAVVNILPGRTVDAEVRLSKATGSVRVRIVLDPDPTATFSDTLSVESGSQSPTWTPIKAWRTTTGVYLLSNLPVPCQTPRITFEQSYPTVRAFDGGASYLDVAFPLIDNSRWVLGTRVDTHLVCDAMLRERTFFVPWTASGPITLLTSKGEILLPDPYAPPSSDTSFVKISVTQGSKPGFLPILATKRDPSGVSILTQYYCQAPVVRSLPDSGIRWVFGADPDIAMKCVVGDPRPVWVFVPKSMCGTIQLEQSNGKLVYLAGEPCVDPIGRVPDTMVVQAQDGIMVSRSFGPRDGLPVLKAWRDREAIWVLSRFDCNIKPQAMYNIHMVPPTGAPTLDSVASFLKRPAPAAIAMTLVKPGAATEIACAEEPVLVRIPFPADKDVLFTGLIDGASFLLPGTTDPVVVDSSFVRYSSSNQRGTGIGFDYVLHADGKVERTLTPGLTSVDTVVVPVVSWIPRDSVAMVASLLESSRIRHPEGACVVAEPAITVDTVASRVDPGFIAKRVPTIRTRLVEYATGAISAQKWDPTQNCVPPQSWSALDAVDRMLALSFDGN